MSHPIPTDMEAAKALSCSPAALDLFMWLSYRCFVAKGRERVPLFGDFGLISQLGSRTMRVLESFARSWKAGSILFVRCGPSVPRPLTRTGTGLFVDRANAVLPGGTDAHC